MPPQSNVVTFPRPPVLHSAEELERRRAEDFARLCGSVLSVSDELRRFNADAAYGRWMCLFEAANRMAKEANKPFRLRRDVEINVFFEALYDLAGAIVLLANELAVLRSRK